MNRLWIKLTVAFLLVALVAVGIVALLSARSTGVEFRQYVIRSSMSPDSPRIQALISYYARNGSWAGAESLLAQAGRGAGFGAGGRRQGAGGPGFTLADADGRVVADATGKLIGEQLSDDVLSQGVPLLLEGRRVGTLLNLGVADVSLDALGTAFLQRVYGSLVWAGTIALVLALALGLVISRRLTGPLNRLTQAVSAIAAGNLSQRVDASGRDEIGELSQAFNRMAATLEESEKLRRNMMADVAHEIRTPLTVIQGNLQAMLDGVYPLDHAQIASLYDETRLLSRLVDDLRDLALAEAGELRMERTQVDLSALVRSVAASFAAAAEAAGVTLTAETAPGVPQIIGDADRLGQVLRNLLSNALRYTPRGGEVHVAVRRSDGGALVTVSDTGSGIAPEDLPHVFDRFYRGDRSRSRRGGGSGLGLAIARQLVLAHGGDISVHSEPGRGTTFTVSLPAGE